MSRLNFDQRTYPGGLRGRLPGFHMDLKPAFAWMRGLMLTLVLAAALVFFAMPADVSADSGGFTTPSYDVNVETTANHVFHVSEEIQVDFNEYRHGVYRYIPNGGKYYGVMNIHVEGYNYQVYTEDGNEVVQIGDPEYTVYGPQTYRLTYDIIGYRDDDSTKDMLSLDLLPTGWPTPIESASLRISFPKEVGDITTYVGAYGSENMKGYFDVNNTGTVYTAVSKEPIPKGVGLTISTDLPEGYWVNPYSRDDKQSTVCLLLAVLGALMLVLWGTIGRDNPIIRTVEFYPPENLDPLEMAYVANDKVEAKEISALFMYLADKGVLSIHENGKKSYTLVKKSPLPQGERKHTRSIYRALFKHGDRADLQHLSSGFGDAAAGIGAEVKTSVEQRKQTFSKASRSGRTLGLAFCLLIPLIAAVADNWMSFGSGIPLLSGVILSLIMFVVMLRLVARTDAFRTKKKPVRIGVGMALFLAAVAAEAYLIGQDYPMLAAAFAFAALAAGIATLFVRRRMNNELYGKVLGFRDFIRTAEYDRLKMLSDENPDYFFNIMPYACVFGMSTKWAEKFADFRIPQPTWYHSSGGSWNPLFVHNMYYYSGHSISGCVADHYKAVGAGMLSDAVDSATSGGGGFGGGGFSGGGFGGGGGGSW